MGALRDLSGRRFDRLTVVRRAIGTQRTMWECRCVCGNVKTVNAMSLLMGRSRSCGCLREEMRPTLHRSHGMRNTPTYKSWCDMKARCYNPKNASFEYYGGRGITVCAQWRNDFAAFLSDMGQRPDGMSIERSDSNGPYEPLNCRWASDEDQANNQRQNHRLTFNGETLTIAQWAKRLGVPSRRIEHRIARGWPVDRALGHSAPS